MLDRKPWARARDDDKINLEYEYEVCLWARHFNASEQRVKEAVAAVGNRAGTVRQHLQQQSSERPTAR